MNEAAERVEGRFGRGREPTTEMRPGEVTKLLDRLEQAGVDV
jgi:hypothetical protein